MLRSVYDDALSFLSSLSLCHLLCRSLSFSLLFFCLAPFSHVSPCVVLPRFKGTKRKKETELYAKERDSHLRAPSLTRACPRVCARTQQARGTVGSTVSHVRDIAAVRACVHAQITREEARADLRDESPRVQPHRWRSQSQSLTPSYHSSARGDQLIVGSAPSRPSSTRPLVRRRQSATSGSVRASSSPVAQQSAPLPRACRPVCVSAVRVYGSTGAPTTVRGRFPSCRWCCLASARKRGAARVPPCRRAGSSRPTTT